ncbi:MAG: response regulator [Selenomonas sp.]|nr:response regulator [Selenomonas sp.]
MNIMLIDDDEAVRSILQDIIEDYDLGTVVASLPSAKELTNDMLAARHVDILIIDMLMPDIDGIKAIAMIRPQFTGKVIMLSQVESKDLVGKAYAQGVDFYITKPLNRNEIVSVLRSVSQHLRLEAFAQNLQGALQSTLHAPPATPAPPAHAPRQQGKALLQDLGIADTSAARDLLALAELAEQDYQRAPLPPLKTMFTQIAEQRSCTDPQKESKAIEQRLRRAIYQAMLNIAAIGQMDYTNPQFEDFAPRFFDYAEIQNLMRQLEREQRPAMGQVHINMKRFVQAFCNAANVDD